MNLHSGLNLIQRNTDARLQRRFVKPRARARESRRYLRFMQRMYEDVVSPWRAVFKSSKISTSSVLGCALFITTRRTCSLVRIEYEISIRRVVHTHHFQFLSPFCRITKDLKRQRRMDWPSAGLTAVDTRKSIVVEEAQIVWTLTRCRHRWSKISRNNYDPSPPARQMQRINWNWGRF